VEHPSDVPVLLDDPFPGHSGARRVHPFLDGSCLVRTDGSCPVRSDAFLRGRRMGVRSSDHRDGLHGPVHQDLWAADPSVRPAASAQRRPEPKRAEDDHHPWLGGLSGSVLRSSDASPVQFGPADR